MGLSWETRLRFGGAGLPAEADAAAANANEAAAEEPLTKP